MKTATVSLVDDNGFRLRTRTREFGGTYALIRHKQEFGVRIENATNGRVMATIKVNGDVAGSFIASGARTIIIKRPSQTNRAFTFIKSGTIEASHVLQNVSREDMGLVQVTIHREKSTVRNVSMLNYTTRGAKSGGVGLGHETDQSFVTVDFEPNLRTAEVHYIRLESADEPDFVSTSAINGYPQPL